jgi:hypothetical protein
MRTSKSTVTSAAPFVLNNNIGELPAGTYDVEVDEQPIVVAGRTAHRRVATLLIIRSTGTSRTLQINPDHLAAALERDARIKGET